MTTISYQHEGRRREVTFTIRSVGAKVAGSLDDGSDLPRDAEQYAYTHGSPGYQAACRAVWESEVWRDAVAAYVDAYGSWPW
jgi:hypothetical protein